MTKIKLCGLFRPEDIEAANRLKPDYAGFVFAPGSPRQIGQTWVFGASSRKSAEHPQKSFVFVFN